jgi:hypothetical protein
LKTEEIVEKHDQNFEPQGESNNIRPTKKRRLSEQKVAVGNQQAKILEGQKPLILEKQRKDLTNDDLSNLLNIHILCPGTKCYKKRESISRRNKTPYTFEWPVLEMW